MNKATSTLLQSEDEQLAKLQQIVQKADKVAAFGGSWKFIKRLVN